MTELEVRTTRWAHFLKTLRRYFEDRGYLEVSTPSLVAAGAFESCLDSLKVSWNGGQCELPTSPEIELKWLLSQVKKPLYQIGKAYRDDPPSPIHWREFTMLEFYRPFVDYRNAQTEMKELICEVADRSLDFQEVSVREIVLEKTGIDLEKANTAEKLKARILDRALISLSGQESWDDLFFKILVEKIEPALDPEQPTLIREYPPSQAALVALDSTQRWAERFEIYWKGMELCNGGTELADLDQLDRRYHQEKAERIQQGKIPHPYPARLFEAIKSLPPCAGVAVGLERLFLCLG
jgi:elongation factor P--(R)-beta-lysine ligase